MSIHGTGPTAPESTEASLREGDELPLLEDDSPEDEVDSPESGSRRVKKKKTRTGNSGATSLTMVPPRMKAAPPGLLRRWRRNHNQHIAGGRKARGNRKSDQR